MKHWSIKTTDSDDFPIRLHIEAQSREGAIAQVREKGYFPESVTEIVPSPPKEKISMLTLSFGVITLITQISFLFYLWATGYWR